MSQSTMVIVPHPVLLDGRRRVESPLMPGETLADMLASEVPDDFDDGWEVRLDGYLVPHEMLARVRPKDGAVIEVRGTVNRQALYLVAMIALTYFTFGTGAAAAGGWGGVSAAVGGGWTGALAATAVYASGSILIPRSIQ